MDIQFWLDFTEALGVVGLLVWGVVTQRSNQNARQIADNAAAQAAQKEELIAQGQALSRLDEKIRAVPTDAELEKIHDRISERNSARQNLAVQVGKLEIGMKRLETSVSRIESHLMGTER